MRCIILISALFVLAGCAGKPYVSVSDSPRAEVTLEVGNLKPGRLSITQLQFEVVPCLGGDLGYIDITPSEPSKTYYVRADRPVYLFVLVTSRGRTGSTYLSFDVEAGRRYRIEYLEGSDAYDMVGYRLNPDGTETPIPVEIGDDVTPPFCDELKEGSWAGESIVRDDAGNLGLERAPPSLWFFRLPGLGKVFGSSELA